jgi:hypothetical protein
MAKELFMKDINHFGVIYGTGPIMADAKICQIK